MNSNLSVLQVFSNAKKKKERKKEKQPTKANKNPATQPEHPEDLTKLYLFCCYELDER